MLQTFIVNAKGFANLKESLKKMPEFNPKPNASPAGIKNIASARLKHDKAMDEFLRNLNNYDIIGWKKDSGINSTKELHGKEVMGELANGCVYVHSIVTSDSEVLQ